MRKIKRLTISLAYRMVFTIVMAFLIFNGILSSLGYYTFEQSLIQECEDAAYRTAKSATMLVSGERVLGFISAEESDYSFSQAQDYLDKLCQSQDATHISVIALDGDFASYETIFYSTDEEYDDGVTEEHDQKYDVDNAELTHDYQLIYEGKMERASLTYKENGVSYVISVVPLKDSAGAVTAIVKVQREMRELDEGTRKYALSIGVSAVLFTVLAALSAFYFMRKQFVVPIRKIIAEMKRFSNEGTKENGIDLNNLSGISEIYDLSTSVGKMESKIVQNTKDLTSITAQQERLNTELTLAQRIQANVLPNIFPPFPERKEFDIFAGMHPAKEVAGDFYDFFLLDDDHLGIVMADVSGKGVPAALFMMGTKIMLKSYAMIDPSPKKVIEAVNDDICSGNSDDMFVTIWFGVLDLKTGVMKAVNAGHEYPVIKKQGHPYELLKDKHGLVVGGMSGIPYHEYEFTMEPGDSLFLYTDGIPEATNKDLEMFGTERMLEALNRCEENDTQQSILQKMEESVHQFVGDADQFDDITMLGLKISYLRDDDSISLVPNTESMDQLSRFLEEKAEEAELSMKLSHQLSIAVDEIYSNVIYYANASCAKVGFKADEQSVTLTFVDDGIPFDPTKADEPDISASLEERQIGGLGILMVKKMCDSISYKREDDLNILEVKYKR